jgi:tetratricopeptide (TPR) repeat protein
MLPPVRPEVEGVDRELVANLTKIHVQTDKGEEQVAGEFVEPVHLQVVCGNLWNNRAAERHTITAADVKKFADVDQTLGEFYNRAVRLAAAGSRTRESAIRAWVAKKLITPGGTRAMVYMGKTSTEGLPNAAVCILETERVVRPEPRAGAAWYELTHDRFIGPIRASNRTWLATHGRWKQVAGLAAAGVVLVLISTVTLSYVHMRQDEARAKQVDADQVKAEREMSQGRNQADDDKWDEALTHYKAALQIYTRLGDQRGQAFAYSRIGSAYSHNDQNRESVSAYDMASKIHSSLGNIEATADDFMGAGNAHNSSTEFDLAVECHQRALDKFKQLGVDSQEGMAGQAFALRQLGQDYRWLGNYAYAKDRLHQSLQLYKTLKEPQPRDEANANEELAAVYLGRGEYDHAIGLFAKVRPVLADLGYKSAAAWAALNWGNALFEKGNLPKAFEKYEQSRKEFRAIDDKAGEGWVLAKLAQFYTAKRLCDQAIDYAKQALTLANERNEHSTLSMIVGTYKAGAYLCSKLLPQAEAEAQHALEETTRAKEKVGQAKNLETLALVAEARGDIPHAVENGEKSVALWDSMGAQTVYARSARANLAKWKKLAAK